MCGIAGIVSANTGPEDLKAQARAMIDAMPHRGPDSNGLWSSERFPICFSHLRLAIQDLSESGHQPMVSASGRRVICYNGEIYNFKEISQQLKKQGVVLHGHSDTEVMLQAIELWGLEKALATFKGMFAFALWDEELGTLSLVRDRIGEKPLYYGIVDGDLVFASELKAIYAIRSPRQLNIDQGALASYLRYGYISAPQSIFEELKKLPPATVATVDLAAWRKEKKPLADCISVEPYWSLEDVSNNAQQFRPEESDAAINELDDLLTSVISKQSISDVPLGSFLSGGIDSTLVTAVLQKVSSRPVETFTIGFGREDFNEAKHAAKIAEHLGTNHNELYLNDQDMLDVVPLLPSMYDEPFADSSQIPTYLVSKFARSKLTVCLSGDGGDELFAGYNRYLSGQKICQINARYPGLVRNIMAGGLRLASPSSWESLYNGVQRIAGRKGGANFGTKLWKAADTLQIDDPQAVYRYLSGYWQKPAPLFSAAVVEPELATSHNFAERFVEAGMAWDQRWYLPGDNLVKTDRASMAVSLEMRVPLLDKDLIEFSWKVPLSMKYRDGQGKWLLRQLLDRYVPKPLIDRPKMGFTVPTGTWVRSLYDEMKHDGLAKIASMSNGMLSREAIERELPDKFTGSAAELNKLWTLLMFQRWYEHYCE